MIKDIPSQANFSPRLRGIYLSLTYPTLRYLANLKSLDFQNVHPSDEKLWDILASHRLELEIVKVAAITSSLVNYILQYRGLREFHILQNDLRPLSAPRPNEKAKKNLLYSALALHQDSLVAFHAYLITWWADSTAMLRLHPEEIDHLKALPGLTAFEMDYEMGIFMRLSRADCY